MSLRRRGAYHQHFAYASCYHHPRLTDKKTEAQDQAEVLVTPKLLSKCQSVGRPWVLRSLFSLDLQARVLTLANGPFCSLFTHRPEACCGAIALSSD